MNWTNSGGVISIYKGNDGKREDYTIPIGCICCLLETNHNYNELADIYFVTYLCEHGFHAVELLLHGCEPWRG
jgi:hypothetical protein